MRKWRTEGDMITLEQFRTTREWHDDMRTVLPDELEHRDTTVAGYVYDNSYYIELVERVEDDVRDWEKLGKWYLVIGNQEWIDYDLTELERHLCEFASTN